MFSHLSDWEGLLAVEEAGPLQLLLLLLLLLLLCSSSPLGECLCVQG